MSWKQERYFTGRQSGHGGPGGGGKGPGGGPPSPPSLDELPAHRRRQVFLATGALLCLALGVTTGLVLAPEGPKELKVQVEAQQKELQAQKLRIAELQSVREGDHPAGRGRLRSADRQRQEREGRRYAAALRRVGAQSAAELMEWFISRWDQLLDYPMEDDRTGRRAATLALLVGGMAANINPGDYVPWQAEFFNANWLGDLHFDMDGDGLPGKRAGKNTHDGFANVSVCHIAMALNQSMIDGRIFMMPDMRCDRPDARMSVFLQGSTFDDALSEFVRAVREQGFLVVEKQERGVRLILVGNRPAPVRDE